MIFLIVFFSFVLFFGVALIIVAFQMNSSEEGIVVFMLGTLMIAVSITLINYGMKKIHQREKILLTYIIDNNLTNEKIRKEFKEEIFEIKKEKAIKKIEKEMEGK